MQLDQLRKHSSDELHHLLEQADKRLKSTEEKNNRLENLVSQLQQDLAMKIENLQGEDSEDLNSMIQGGATHEKIAQLFADASRIQEYQPQFKPLEKPHFEKHAIKPVEKHELRRVEPFQEAKARSVQNDFQIHPVQKYEHQPLQKVEFYKEPLVIPTQLHEQVGIHQLPTHIMPKEEAQTHVSHPADQTHKTELQQHHHDDVNAHSHEDTQVAQTQSDDKPPIKQQQFDTSNIPGKQLGFKQPPPKYPIHKINNDTNTKATEMPANLFKPRENEKTQEISQSMPVTQQNQPLKTENITNQQDHPPKSDNIVGMQEVTSKGEDWMRPPTIVKTGVPRKPIGNPFQKLAQNQPPNIQQQNQGSDNRLRASVDTLRNLASITFYFTLLNY